MSQDYGIPADEKVVTMPVSTPLALFGWASAASKDVHNFITTDRKQALARISCCSSNATPLETLHGKVIEVEFFHVRPVTFYDKETDSYKTVLRMTIITPKGERIGTTSEGAIATMAMYTDLDRGNGGFKPPVRFEVSRIKTRGEYYCTNLTPVDDVPSESVKPK